MTAKKRILLLTTGGTIASVPGGEGLEPRRSEVMERELEQLRTYYDISVKDVICLDSSNIRPEEWQLIARHIFEDRAGYDGIVVSHGTDTMAYTASAVTFMLPNIDVPVVFTGSQLPLTDMLSDGPDNLRTAFAMAASGAPGVFLAFDRKVMLGCRAVKVRASGFSAFESVNARYAALVSNRGLVVDTDVLPRRTGESKLLSDISKEVFLLKLTPGLNPAIFDMLAATENAVMEVPDGSIDFENVSFRYSATAKHRALKEVNLHIPSGATVGILGGTGSSKTTLVQLIPRLYDVSEGTLKVGGIDVRKYDLEVLRDNVAMVLQKNELFSGTIKENLRWGNPNATDEELVHACRLACADEFIRSFPDGYDTHIEQGGTNVSGGQKQRLCIARALLKKPKILILDDSTSAVDTRTDAMIRQAFREEIPGTTKLIIAQRIASVQDADIIVVLDNGMVKDVGTHESLLASSKIYQEVYYSQQKGGEE